MNKHPWYALLATILVVATLIAPAGPAAADDSRYFPATGHTVRGNFLQYWDANGGLAQQGYPISDELQERSDIDGQVYTLQYFQRAVFEHHPENQPPYDVLLTLLGTLLYQQKYPHGAPGQHASTDNPRVFPQTGKTMGGVFRRYWETHGGLAQQGYPISDEFQERNETDGKTYTVQYFQRAVFEYHPENAGTPYEVLLSLLGTFRYDQIYGHQPPPPVASPPPPNPTATTPPQPPPSGAPVFFYKGPTGGGVVGRVGADGSYADVQTTGGFNPAWTHIVASGNLLLFYQAGSSLGAVDRVNADGSLTDLQVYHTFYAHWTAITALSNGVLLFYDQNTGTAATLRLDAGGNINNLRTPTNLAKGWTVVMGGLITHP